MGLVYIWNVDYGKIEVIVIVSKEFMFQFNMFRFVCVGDKVNIVVLLMNLLDKGVKGIVCMELFNLEIEKVFYL